MLETALKEISGDKDAISTLQSYYNAYTIECEALRKTEGNADGVSDKWTDKTYSYLVDWLIYKASEEVSDWSDTDDFSYDEFDREIIERFLYDTSAPYRSC